MSNFLEDYIWLRGEDTVIKTQYGILDIETGEHLVPVQHPEYYFEGVVYDVSNLPNTGKPKRVTPPITDFYLMDENGDYILDENNERMET